MWKILWFCKEKVTSHGYILNCSAPLFPASSPTLHLSSFNQACQSTTVVLWVLWVRKPEARWSIFSLTWRHWPESQRGAQKLLVSSPHCWRPRLSAGLTPALPSPLRCGLCVWLHTEARPPDPEYLALPWQRPQVLLTLTRSLPQTAGCCRLLPAPSHSAGRTQRLSAAPVRGLFWELSLRQSAGMGAGPEQLQTWSEYG